MANLRPSFSTTNFFSFKAELYLTPSKIPTLSSPSFKNFNISVSRNSKYSLSNLFFLFKSVVFMGFLEFIFSGFCLSTVSAASVEDQVEVEVEVAEGFTITQFCDKMIEVFLNEKPKSKDWRKYLVFRDEWKKYRDRFYNRCSTRADAENDASMKQKLITLSRKVKKVADV